MKQAAIVLSLLLGIYVLSYVVLSRFGAYAPLVWGPSQEGWRPKSYHWAPPGFYVPSTGKWRSVGTHPIHIYAPLWALDNWTWHTHIFPEAGEPEHPLVIPNFSDE